MNKHASRKLSLKRETLTPMQDDELAAVNGGVSPLASVAASISIRASGLALRSSQQCAIGAGNFIAGSFSVSKLFK